MNSFIKDTHHQIAVVNYSKVENIIQNLDYLSKKYLKEYGLRLSVDTNFNTDTPLYSISLTYNGSNGSGYSFEIVDSVTKKEIVATYYPMIEYLLIEKTLGKFIYNKLVTEVRNGYRPVAVLNNFKAITNLKDKR